MAMSVNNVISTYTYTYNNNMRGKLDKDSDAFWSREEVENYAKDYNAATGKTLDVNAIFEKYANSDGVIDYDSQNKMLEDDALGFSVLKSSASSSSSSTSSTSTSSSSTTTNANSMATADQRSAVFNAVSAFTYQYGGKFQPLLDKNDDGMWNREELDNYAVAYKKATGNTLDVDAIMKKYANEDGNIDPTNQAAVKKDDALGLTALKSAYDKAVTARNEAVNTTERYKGYTKDTTIYGKTSSGDFSMQDLLGSMSSSQKMAFSLGINRLDNQSSLLNSMFGGTSSASSSYLSSLLSSSNTAKMYSSASGSNSDAVYAAMSGQLMNFTL